MAIDLSPEKENFANAVYGIQVRGSMVSLADKIESETADFEAEVNAQLDTQLVAVDKTLKISGDGADAEQTGLAVNALSSAAMIRCTWEVGEISVSGAKYESERGARFVAPVPMRMGDVIRCPDGYGFRAYLYESETYSAAVDRSDFITGGYYIIPFDCFVAVTGQYYPAQTVEVAEEIADNILAMRGNRESEAFYTQEVPFMIPAMKQWYDTDGSKFNRDTHTAISTTDDFYSAIIECTQGDQFFLTGVGSNGARLWAFVDSEDNIIEASAANVTANKLLLTAPQGTVLLVINSKNSEPVLSKVTTVEARVNAEIEKKATRLVPTTAIVASFLRTTKSNPAMHYEANCRTFGFHMRDGATYTVKFDGQTSLRAGFLFDEVAFEKEKSSDSSNDILFQGFKQFDTNPFTFRNHGYKTCFVYGSSNTVEHDVDVVVTETVDLEDWADGVAKQEANRDIAIAEMGLFGQPEVYFSEPTAEAETSLDAKTVAELYALYDDMCTRYPGMIKRVTDIGTDASGTYEIREYFLSLQNPLVSTGEISLSGEIDLTNVTNLWKSKFANNILAVSAGMHGCEKSAAWGLALAIQEIIESDRPFATFLRSNFEIHIIPCINPWGFAHNARRNSNNVDINRDFLDYSQPETVAFRDWITSIADRCVAYIDSHGTTGYYAYFETSGESDFWEGYCKACAKFTAAVQPNWTQFYADCGVTDKYPYCYMARSTYFGTKRLLTQQLGLLGHTVETPQNFVHGDRQAWNNDLQACKLTKDLLINTMQMYGEWGYRVKNHKNNPLNLEGTI